jgi:hypothetical protein
VHTRVPGDETAASRSVHVDVAIVEGAGLAGQIDICDVDTGLVNATNYSLGLESHKFATPPQRWTGWGYESDPEVWTKALSTGTERSC